MKAIVAVDKNWGIGKNNELLFSIPEDMKFFRETTKGKTVVMGSKTLKSLPGGNPLKNRTNIVLSNTIVREDCIIVNSITELGVELSKYNSEDVYVIGGAMLYKTLLPYCSEALVTKIDADGNPDVFFENLDCLPDWELKNESSEIQTDCYKIKFTVYKNLNTKSL
ncbi:MAG: dihydrofolate reductase [Clostridia bacterium]|nr:dihydrofolate reductase [Clostridia bacterium]